LLGDLDVGKEGQDTLVAILYEVALAGATELTYAHLFKLHCLPGQSQVLVFRHKKSMLFP
jgi:hypothetical protein